MNEGIVDRVRKIIDHYGVSVSAFAKALGVQRSSVSHILSGRNKPSLDFVLKLMETYPEINLYWLLNGLGDFLKDSDDPTTLNQNDNRNMASTSSISNLKNATSNVKEVEPTQIVIFYTDGSFQTFNPKKK